MLCGPHPSHGLGQQGFSTAGGSVQQEAPWRSHSKLLVNLWMVHVNQQLTELLQQPTVAINAKKNTSGDKTTTTTPLGAGVNLQKCQRSLITVERTVKVASFPPTSSNFRDGTCSSGDFDFAETQVPVTMNSFNETQQQTHYKMFASKLTQSSRIWVPWRSCPWFRTSCVINRHRI